MKLYVVIPTYKRIKKLYRCIRSILESIGQNYRIAVMVDGNDYNTYKAVKNMGISSVDSHLSFERLLAPGNWNKFFKLYQGKEWDGALWLCDDTEIYPDCLKKAVGCLIKNFPDTDGIVGINQTCPGHPEYKGMPYGQVLIGRKFVERFKEVDYQVCCVDYKWQFQDEELWEYAKSLNKFVFCKEAKMLHYHPSRMPEQMDETHKLSRLPSIRAWDQRTYKERKRRELIWGKNWEVING